MVPLDATIVLELSNVELQIGTWYIASNFKQYM